MSVATDVRSRPILFSSPIVKAILNGRKGMTRRVVKPQPEATPYGFRFPGQGIKIQGERDSWILLDNEKHQRWIERCCPYGRPGDALYVRETWQSVPPGPHRDWPGIGSLRPRKASEFNRACVVIYKADGEMPGEEVWRPSIHMPRWASRLALEITAVRVERLNAISEADARAEGVEWNEGPFRSGHTNHVSAFRSLWNTINGRSQGRTWQDNPWVWAISFQRI
jgi:hypothetical protein